MKGIKLIIISILIAFSFSAKSQLNYGVLGGFSSSSFLGSDMQRFLNDPKVKLHFGGTAHLKIYKSIGLRMDVMYQAKGAGFSYVDTNGTFAGNVDITQKLGYLSIPLQIQFTPGASVKNGFHINLGVVANYLLHNKFEGIIEQEDANGEMIESPFPQKLSPKSNELGFRFGFGLSSSGILFEFNYEQSFDKLYSIDGGVAPSIKNSILSVTVGYLF